MATKIPRASGPKTKTKQKQCSNKFNKNFKNGLHQKKKKTRKKKRNITVKTTQVFMIKKKDLRNYE